jgi:glycosyltransferase involved in cell wall biosynthesis
VIAPANAADPRKGAAAAAEAARLAGVDLEFSDNLERDLPRASVLLYLTYTEGLGSAVLLAMASGAAVVASRVGGLPEAIEDGVTGLLVDGTPQAAAAALERLTRDPGMARELGGRARDKAAREFSVDKMVEGTMTVYHEVSGRKSSRARR